jgi:hypothetical protein
MGGLFSFAETIASRCARLSDPTGDHDSRSAGRGDRCGYPAHRCESPGAPALREHSCHARVRDSTANDPDSDRDDRCARRDDHRGCPAGRVAGRDNRSANSAQKRWTRILTAPTSPYSTILFSCSDPPIFDSSKWLPNETPLSWPSFADVKATLWKSLST